MWKSLKKQFDSPDSYVSLALGLAVVLVIGMIAYNYFRSRTELGAPGNEQEKQEQAVKLPATHAVKAGETLWSIAQTYYKSGYNWVDIQAANNLANADAIEAGQTLTIPDVKPIQPPGEVSSASVEAKPEKKTYTVVRGDSLWNIAMKTYGSGYKWTAIAQASGLTNPDIIHAGNVLTLP